MNFSECAESLWNEVVVVSERRREFRIHNGGREKIVKVLVDGCLIDDHRERCDYVFEFGKPCYCVVYVELKGKDVEKAFSQLSATLLHLGARHKNLRRICHIVASRVPKSGPKVQQLKLLMAKRFNTLLHVSTIRAAVNMSESPYCKDEP